ncbi:glutamyl-tRNA(Gln) amidotransferase subunit C, chloroplastic/mitochondrial-like [Bidens hawaiensis]|uniref:glutamyl-tRNA(Gln) amidotransferase subunit C, chloroplastic/mitochondrial-like n=1 Tax=Bidens hawaiensis TaxID=980011 RepID=UPI0040495EB5
MGSRALLLLSPAFKSDHILLNHFTKKYGFPRTFIQTERTQRNVVSGCLVGAREYAVHSSLERPDVARLAETARISLTPQEAEEFAPKIQQVVDWFGQLQDVDLQSVEPAIRPDTEAGSFREDSPETFDNREAIIAAIPSYEEPYIKVPKALNKD